MNKPYPTFPLTPRADGRFGKKIRGRYYTFGRGGDWKQAHEEYLAIAQSLHSDETTAPMPANPQRITVKQLGNLYLNARRRDVQAATMSLRTWDDYRGALDRFCRFAGPSTLASNLGPAIFTRYSDHLSKTLGPRAFNRNRSLLRTWLKHAALAEWCKPINIGIGFKRIHAGRIRAIRRQRAFTAAQCRKLLKLASPQMRAMILLGLNGGLGSTDCARLTIDKLDLRAKVLNYDRSKTNIARSIPLWRETVAAIKTVIAERPTDTHVFRTGHGNLWVRADASKKPLGRVAVNDAVCQEFGKLMDAAKITMPGVGFYGLRHTFREIADEVRDPHAIMRIMGHSFPGMNDVYVESISLDRLRSVVNHVASVLKLKC